MSNPLPLQNLISQSSTFTKTYRMISMQLGDGYSQRRPDGLNPVGWVGSIVYTNLSDANCNTLMTFLDAIGSWGTFDYAPPQTGGVTSKWSVTTDGVQMALASGNVWNVTIACQNQYDI